MHGLTGMLLAQSSLGLFLAEGQREKSAAETSFTFHTLRAPGVSMSSEFYHLINNRYNPLDKGTMWLTGHGSLFCHEICTFSLVKVIEQKDELLIFHFFF